ncbi:hypothetical protein N8956_00270 [bacterium]|jgi:hypothetical protein|nr:hypothetical protein [bacterium]
MKLWNKFINFWITGMPGFEKPLLLKDEVKTDLKHLRTQTKSELEKLGRKVGVELDKRLTKEKLIKQIRKHSK